jgi:AcrR family transcriptional regulator
MMSIRHTEARDAGLDDLPDAVLDAARESVLAVGWRRTTLTEVARRAGVSRMTIYRRWPDVATMLGDLLVREWDAVLATTPLAVDEAITPAQVAASMTAVVRAVREQPLLARIVDLDPELLLPYLLQRRGRNQDRVLDLLAGVLRHGQQQGTVRDGDPVLLARSLLLAAQGFVLSLRTMTDSGVTAQALDAELHHLIERHLEP